MPRSLPDINRRSFLKGTFGTAAALAVSTAYSRDLLAQEAASPFAGYTFLSPSEVTTLEALAEQIWPSDDTIGGRDAGVVTYIDRALSGAYSQYQPVYRLGLEWVDQAANEEFGANFADLESDQQFAFLETHLGVPGDSSSATPGASPVSATPEGDLGVEGMPLPAEQATPAGTGGQGSGSTGALADSAAGVEESTGDGTVAGAPMLAGGDAPQIADVSEFLNIVLTHTIEGLFADPAYGGNRDKAVWESLRYGGPYYVHTEEQQTSFEPLDLPVQSIADL